MAKYNINGSTYAVDDSIQGDDLNATLTQLAEYTASQNQQKFLAFLAKSEGADYDTIVGGRQKISDFTTHPNVVGLRTVDGPSTAAGRYQITGTTYRTAAPSAGVSDFSPESQDKLALHLISQKGAMDDVTSGNFQAAIGKLGGVWASLPSSKYGQSHRSQEWVNQALGQPYTAPAPVTAAPGYQSFGTVIKNNDQATLATNQDWLKASRQIYSWKERKQFTGTDDEAAEYGKSVMGYFNNNVIMMTKDAAGLVQHGTQDDKNAFLYMMDQYDENKVSWAGTGRAALGMVTDPVNLVGIGTLGTATVAKVAASIAAKDALRKIILTSVGRTGIQAGILGGIQAGVTDTIKQGVAVSGGRQDSLHLGEIAGHAAIGVATGVALGTTADALLTVAAPVVKKAVGKIMEVAGIGKKAAPVVHDVVPTVVPHDVPGAPPVAPVTPHEVPTGAVPATPPPGAAADATLPITSTLTAEELRAAGTRAQKGRLWTDDIPHELPLNGGPAANLVIPQSAPGLRATERNMAQLTEDGGKVADQLRTLDDPDLRQTLEVLRSSISLQDAPTIFRAVQILHDEGRVELAELMKKIESAAPDSLAPLMAKKDALEDRLIHIQLADDAMGSFGGSLNRQRQEGLVGLQGSTVESLMKEKGISKEEATKLWQDLVDASQVSSKAKQVAGEYEVKIQSALDANDLGEVGRLSILKRSELNAIAEEAAPSGSSFMQSLHTGFGGLRELMISNLFTVKTVMVNLVPAAIKTIALPAAKYLVGNPLEKASIAELGAHYAAMGGTVRAALTAARTAFRYEQSILTRDSGRLLEGEMIMKGKTGGGLRFFPRVLNASDEFLSQINYAGFVAGKAANKAVIEGTEKGLTGKALKDFVGDSVNAAKATMYEGLDESSVQPIINKGVNFGLSGEALLQFVQREGAKSPEALRHGADKVGLDFSRDVLYKRPFSGGNTGDGAYKSSASGGAVFIERFLHKTPMFSLVIGQLFFRTPIRVFEEGVRMTPGVQILAPGFMKDLAGGNGQMRQVRAQAEALMSLTITGAALALYASGSITGSGSYNNFKQDKTRKDGPAPEPYTIRFKDGSTWNFKNIDPISTPLKMLINAFEGMDELMIKEAQEAYVDKPAHKLLMARISVGTMAIAAAITDANLVAGLKGTMDFAADFADPEGDEAALVKKLGTELGMLVPNTLHKIAQSIDPRMRDPATLFQSIETRLGHNLVGTDEIKSAFAYDPLGQVRRPADIGSMWNIFDTQSQEDRSRGRSDEHQQLMLEFDRLAKETGAVFAPATPKHQMTGELDLRTMMTADKSETMYDRWQRNYRDLNPDQVLLPIAQSGAPDGTFKIKGMKVEMLQSEMKILQDVAFQQLLTDERIRERLIQNETRKARAGAGLMDFSNRNK
jgi:muramidase (phage lysozyme)/DNA-directed RNA polymerase subunit F